MARLPLQVRSLKHLRDFLKLANRPLDFALMLNGGVFSKKTIDLRKDGKFAVFNHIDNTQQTLGSKGLRTHSNIAEAIKKGSFYWLVD